MQAFTARGTSDRFSPGGIEVGDDPYLVTAVLDIPVVGTFHFITYADTTGAHDTAVVIQYIPGMGGIHFALRKEVRVADMIEANMIAQVLQFTFTIGHTYGTYVIAFGK